MKLFLGKFALMMGANAPQKYYYSLAWDRQ